MVEPKVAKSVNQALNVANAEAKAVAINMATVVTNAV